jgi:hypothetical protein
MGGAASDLEALVVEVEFSHHRAEHVVGDLSGVTETDDLLALRVEDVPDHPLPGDRPPIEIFFFVKCSGPLREPARAELVDRS